MLLNTLLSIYKYVTDEIGVGNGNVEKFFVYNFYNIMWEDEMLKKKRTNIFMSC